MSIGLIKFHKIINAKVRIISEFRCVAFIFFSERPFGFSLNDNLLLFIDFFALKFRILEKNAYICSVVS